MDVGDFRELVVRPALRHLAEQGFKPGLWSPAAENLVVGTAAHESGGFRYLWQRQANGVRLAHEQAGRGLFQIQPNTHQDMWLNYLRFRPPLMVALRDLSIWARQSIRPENGPADDQELIGNLPYAAAVCRLIYWRKKPPLPPADDIEGLAKYWGQHYQTENDPKKIKDFISNYRRYVEKE